MQTDAECEHCTCTSGLQRIEEYVLQFVRYFELDIAGWKELWSGDPSQGCPSGRATQCWSKYNDDNDIKNRPE